MATTASVPFPATARLRAGIFTAGDVEALIALFAAALAEHGIDGHFCLARGNAGLVPMAGDQPRLMLAPPGSIIVDGDMQRVVLARPSVDLTRQAAARVRGYAELFGAQVAALRELSDDVDTECGLSLRERYVLGRRLAGLAPVDIAIEAGLSVPTIAAAIDGAIAQMGVTTLAEAISLAARRGWLAVTTLQNCSSISAHSPYKMTQNG